MTNKDLPLIIKVKELREAHLPYKPYENRPLMCVKCSEVDLVTFPCMDVQVYDALIRVHDLGQFAVSAANLSLDGEATGKEILYAIQYGYSYEAGA